MVKLLMYGALLLTLTLTLASCGKSMENSKCFGKIPDLILAQEAEMDAVHAEMEKAGDSKSEMESIFKKIEKREAWYKEQFAAESELLKGKEIVVEVESGTPVKMTKPLIIEGVNEKGNILLTGEMETTEDISFSEKQFPYEGGANIRMVLVNDNGEPVKVYYPGHIRETQYLPEETISAGKKVGIKTKVSLKKEEAEDIKSTSKIILVNTRTSALYEKAKSKE